MNEYKEITPGLSCTWNWKDGTIIISDERLKDKNLGFDILRSINRMINIEFNLPRTVKKEKK